MSGGIVAIVDDDKAVLESLRFVLDIYGFKVMAYSMSMSFLEDRVTRPACVIVDQNMPGMNGLELVARLRQEGNLVPVLLTTGMPTTGIAAHAERLGIERVVAKPAELDEFLSFVGKYC